MDNMAYPMGVSALALLVYYYTMFEAGRARGRFKVEAPSHSGPPEYDRIVRAHQNTLEHLVIFLPALWLFAVSISPIWAAVIGIVWPVARLWYARGYYASAEKRIPGLLVSMPVIYILVLGALVGAVLMMI